MDVSCPRCSTEYELDDARISPEGITVKCTQCSHVFRVKKTLAPAAVPPGELPPAAPLREWRVRQANGNQFSCRELTILQRWIIEGKVGRDDEISLSGDTWKRLGNIPELASFFQVAEDAARGRAFEAMRTSGSFPAFAPPNAAPTPIVPTGSHPIGTMPSLTETWKEPAFAVPAPQPPQPPPPPSEPAQPARETLKGPDFASPAPAPRPQRPTVAPPSDEELERAVKGGGGGKWVVLVLLGILIGGGAGYYFAFYQPEQDRLAAEAVARAAADADALKAEEAARVKAQQEEAERQAALLAAQADAGPPDAGVEEVVDAGAPVEVAPKPKRTFDWYLAQGDRLRERDRAEAALDMYGQAADMAPDRMEPLAGRGLALLDMGQTLAAQASFEQAPKVNGRYGPAIMGLAESLRMQKKNKQALVYYQKYLEVLPNGPEAAVATSNIERLK